MTGPSSHRLRIGRHSEPGRVYLVTFATHARSPHFLDWNAAACVAGSLALRAAWPTARLLCWVLMPDHWHGLVELSDESLPRAVGRAKALATRRWHLQRGTPEHLWAQGFHDRAIRKEEDLLVTARCVVANPVRAGLVKRIGDYPFWNAVWL